jgi:hypothetical protein
MTAANIKGNTIHCKCTASKNVNSMGSTRNRSAKVNFIWRLNVKNSTGRHLLDLDDIQNVKSNDAENKPETTEETVPVLIEEIIQEKSESQPWAQAHNDKGPNKGYTRKIIRPTGTLRAPNGKLPQNGAEASSPKKKRRCRLPKKKA